MSQIQKYNMWKQHFNDMTKGEILPNQSVVIVKGKPNFQIGSGLRLVAATEQTAPLINRRKKPRKKQSSVKRLTKNIKKSKKKTPSKKPTKKKPVKRTRKR